ncbi:MAG: hypothetical protein G01um101416_490 [Microgenomates group bacterium Gr01-1014_16]|nr:MAG: hypothetical protein G01um101416_490 [Microgenomates group bacterium Gr01-1014_16]
MRKLLIKKLREMGGVERWEMVARMWQEAKEFRNMGRKYYGAKRVA